MPHRPVQIVVLVMVLALCAYLVWSGSTNQANSQVLPQGPQTLTGTLIPAELSLTRRGTHVLKVDGDDVAFVESAAVNLRRSRRLISPLFQPRSRSWV